MIVTEQKNFKEILEMLEGRTNIFLIGCGECATICKTGGKDELLRMQQELEKAGKRIVGSCIPDAPCIASQMKSEFAKNIKGLREAEAVLVLACGLGAQSAKQNSRIDLEVFPGCNTLFSAVVDGEGNLCQMCSLCGECVLGITAGICPVTLCPKGLLNGPCGGMDQGKCEVDKERDCAWVLIYQELEKRKKLDSLKKIQPAKDFKKTTKPHKIIAAAK